MQAWTPPPDDCTALQRAQASGNPGSGTKQSGYAAGAESHSAHEAVTSAGGVRIYYT